MLKAIATYLYSRPYCIYLAKEKEKIGKLYIFCQIFMQYPMKAWCIIKPSKDEHPVNGHYFSPRLCDRLGGTAESRISISFELWLCVERRFALSNYIFFSDCVGRFFFFFLQTFDLVIVFTCNEKRPIVRLVFDFNFIKAIVDLHWYYYYW